MSEPTSAAAWDAEYERGGIPSSTRDAPSTPVVWLLQMWPLLTGSERPLTALDVGCGTGRNSVYMGAHGVSVRAFDLSPTAVAAARERADRAHVGLDIAVHDLTAGLPVADAEIELITDLFVYKHQTDIESRRQYRSEAARVLNAGGRLLVSLAEPEDGYYRACPELPGDAHGLRVVIDPSVGGAGSVLFSLEQLVAEMSDFFDLEIAWRKQNIGEMHGRHYTRHTLATVWRPRSRHTGCENDARDPGQRHLGRPHDGRVVAPAEPLPTSSP